MHDSNPPLGLPSAQARGVDHADIISAVEQTSNGDSLITLGHLPIMFSGRLGQVREQGTVRLTPTEREELIARLMEHRFTDLTAGLSGPDGGNR